MADEKVFEKVDATTIRMVKVLPVQFDYKLDFLVEQRLRIIAQKERDNAQRDLEIAECDELIAKCAELAVASEIELKAIEEAKVITPVTEIKAEG